MLCLGLSKMVNSRLLKIVHYRKNPSNNLKLNALSTLVEGFN